MEIVMCNFKFIYNIVYTRKDRWFLAEIWGGNHDKTFVNFPKKNIKYSERIKKERQISIFIKILPIFVTGRKTIGYGSAKAARDFFMLVNEIKTSKIIWNQSQSVILKSILWCWDNSKSIWCKIR